jgi:hypothetical protein
METAMQKALYIIAIIGIGVVSLAFLNNLPPSTANNSSHEQAMDIGAIHRAIKGSALPVTDVKEPF